MGHGGDVRFFFFFFFFFFLNVRGGGGVVGLQGYLAHKKTHPPRTLP